MLIVKAYSDLKVLKKLWIFFFVFFFNCLQNYNLKISYCKIFNKKCKDRTTTDFLCQNEAI